jgi:hypothetical protein
VNDTKEFVPGYTNYATIFKTEQQRQLPDLRTNFAFPSPLSAAAALNASILARTELHCVLGGSCYYSSVVLEIRRVESGRVQTDETRGENRVRSTTINTKGVRICYFFSRGQKVLRFKMSPLFCQLSLNMLGRQQRLILLVENDQQVVQLVKQ